MIPTIPENVCKSCHFMFQIKKNWIYSILLVVVQKKLYVDNSIVKNQIFNASWDILYVNNNIGI